MAEKVKALYGFDPELSPFQGKSPAEQVALLQSWGSNAIFGGYQDCDFIEAAHGAGLKVYAEFPCFVGEQAWQTYPDSRPLTEAGRPLEPVEWYYGVNPAIPSLRQARLAALEQLLSDYELDGIWLDFIRWPCRWERPDPYRPLTSFDPVTLARFGQETGLELPLAEPKQAAELILQQHEAAWVTWRCEQITTWVAVARAVVDRVRPGAILGLFGIPWRLADYEGAILKIVGQDYLALGQYVDIFSPMVYHRLCGQPLAWIESVTAEVQALTGKPVWPIIQSIDEPEPWPAEEYGQAIDLVLQGGIASGILIFNLKGLLAEAKLRVTGVKFKRVF